MAALRAIAFAPALAIFARHQTEVLPEQVFKGLGIKE
jgi:hypothetical protein